MPIFEFRCLKCKKKFERICSFDESEKEFQPCPAPSHHGLLQLADKLASVSQTRFKGAGFYNTTYQRSEAKDRIVEQAGE